jgi:hypothetical protein
VQPEDERRRFGHRAQLQRMTERAGTRVGARDEAIDDRQQETRGRRAQ